MYMHVVCALFVLTLITMYTAVQPLWNCCRKFSELRTTSYIASLAFIFYIIIEFGPRWGAYGAPQISYDRTTLPQTAYSRLGSGISSTPEASRLDGALCTQKQTDTELPPKSNFLSVPDCDWQRRRAD